jgi:succinate dehydrogenase / fumarate reductase cytochrome b subunit
LAFRVFNPNSRAPDKTGKSKDALNFPPEGAYKMPAMSFGKLFTTTVGKKLIMGATGFGLVMFMIIHMLGNTNVLMGRESMNNYAATMQSMGALLWVARGGLLAAALLHIWAAITLTRQNRLARPEAYAENKLPGASLASRTMAVTGILLLGLFIYHLLHFTLGQIDPVTFAAVDAKGRHDAYFMVVKAFENPLVSFSYMIFVGLVCIHMSHGIESFFRSLGLMGKRWQAMQSTGAKIVAALLFVGFVSVPSAVLLGLITH